MTELERVIREHSEAVLWSTIAELIEHHDAITELAIERSGPGSIGEAEYPGDPILLKTPAQLTTDSLEERADDRVYGCVKREITTRG